MSAPNLLIGLAVIVFGVVAVFIIGLVVASVLTANEHRKKKNRT